MEKACPSCRRLSKGNICPICKNFSTTKSWKGVIVVLDAESEIAKEAGLTAPGKYAVKVKQ